MKHAMYKSLGILLIVMACLVPIISIVNSALKPRFYRSHAVVQVVFPEASIEKYDAESLNSMTRTIGSLAYSDDVLMATAEALHLGKVWGKRYQIQNGVLDETNMLQILGHRLSTDLVEGSVGLMRIGTVNEDAKEAATVANVIAEQLATYLSGHPQQIEGVEVRLVTRAKPALRHYYPNMIATTVISGICGLFLGISGFLLIYLGNRAQRRSGIGADPANAGHQPISSGQVLNPTQY